MKNKYLIFSIFAIAFLFASASFVLALEVTYPNMPMLPNLNTSNPGIGEYVGYFFGLLIYVAGIVSLISFTVGAVQLISPSVEAHNDAKDRMKGAVLGLVLTLASFVIIRTINPALITPTLNPLPGVAGIFLINGSQQRPAPQEEVDTSKYLQDGFNQIKYCCNSDCSGGFNNNLLVWKFPKTNLEGGNTDINSTVVDRVQCGGTSDIDNFGSFKMAFENYGVYFCFGGCNGNMCAGYMSGVNTTSQNNINVPPGTRITAVRIVNDNWGTFNDDPKSDTYYGVILHKNSDLQSGGQCGGVITHEGCYPVNIDARSVDIFRLNQNPGTAGDGVSFYSEPFGTASSARAGYYLVSDNEIALPPPPTEIFAGDMNFLWNNVPAPEGYKAQCETFQSCPGSIKIKGSYLVGLYSGMSYCQTFTQDVNNLKAEPILAPGDKQINSVLIIPTK